MLKNLQLHQSNSTTKAIFSPSKQFLHGSTGRLRSLSLQKKLKNAQVSGTTRLCVKANAEQIKTATQVVSTTTILSETTIKVKATILADEADSSFLNLGGWVDELKGLLGKPLTLELVSAELDPKTGLEKPTIKAKAKKIEEKGDALKFEAEFKVPPNFGDVGAVYIDNDLNLELYLKEIVLDGFPYGPVILTCNSWVQPNDTVPKRVFFSNKSYLPSETPTGLRRLREEELISLRGNGKGERKKTDRIYDYDVYNDLGNPEKSQDLKRPVLGGKDHPYPRRCRTGRPMSKKDPNSERRSSGSIYVPRDETFSEIKDTVFGSRKYYVALHSLVPNIESVLKDSEQGFTQFQDIDELFKEGVNLEAIKDKGLAAILPAVVRTVSNFTEEILRFDVPKTMDRDNFFWFRDEEFSRQTLAGINPIAIQLVTEWPLKSKLDPEIYGPAESAITKETIEKEIKGYCTLEEAIKQKKLFVLDYHDLLLPYVSKVRQLKDIVLYGSRTLFFLTEEGTLRPLAIELTRPKIDDKPQWKQVFTPCWSSTGVWLWRLAKAHVLAHDSGYHQLVSHWLRTHCATEPYVIATNRQLSIMHPIYKLLDPHFRFTMEINAFARDSLVNANGIIETTFSPGKYSIELSSVAYDKLWRFDREGLPNDLISRGMAVEDPSAPHGVKLTIEDYPYANDGLLVWDAIKTWVTDYVNHYYPDPALVESDQELQQWWTEIRTVGHGDKKDEPWWPVLKTPTDLIAIITTIVWVASGHHAAVNFGQYDYGAYFPSRPTLARTKMPTEDKTYEDWEKFLKKPTRALLNCFPSQLQATTVMIVLSVLSDHSADEQYIGEHMETPWGDNPVIKAAFERFSGRLKEVEGIIDARNTDENLHNRNGAGIVPYELLKPTSKPGITSQGVPYSISI
ncbi:Lipoxygenase [Quillaja saponaria]|uniref:Lipoxygenase n=1 Tax=Quillaja saponaria TaxID=32244 RepID=A0AAD7PP03_QUISA|nr:Lipoxygenase [Quillaja saponaria]